MGRTLLKVLRPRLHSRLHSMPLKQESTLLSVLTPSIQSTMTYRLLRSLPYLDDVEEVAAAKAEFQAAFDDAAAGGLAAKQAPAPVHVIPEPAPLAVAPAPVVEGVPVLATHPYAAGFPIHGLGYAGIPYAAGLGYHGLAYNTIGYHGLGFPYAGLPVVAAAAPTAEE